LFFCFFCLFFFLFFICSTYIHLLKCLIHPHCTLCFSECTHCKFSVDGEIPYFFNTTSVQQQKKKKSSHSTRFLQFNFRKNFFCHHFWWDCGCHTNISLCLFFEYIFATTSGLSNIISKMTGFRCLQNKVH